MKKETKYALNKCPAFYCTLCLRSEIFTHIYKRTVCLQYSIAVMYAGIRKYFGK